MSKPGAASPPAHPQDPAALPIPWRVLAALGVGLAILYAWPNHLGPWAFSHEAPLFGLGLQGQAVVTRSLAQGLDALLIEAGRGASAVLMLAVVAAVFALARRLLGPGWAVLAAALAGVTPLATVTAHVSAPEPLALALVLWGMVLALSAPGAQRWGAAVAGGLAGAGLLIAPHVSLAALALSVPLLPADGRLRLAGAVPLGLAALGVLAMEGLSPAAASPPAETLGLAERLMLTLSAGVGRGFTWMLALPTLLIVGLMVGQARDLPRVTAVLVVATVLGLGGVVVASPADGAALFAHLTPLLAPCCILLVQGVFTLTLGLAPMARLVGVSVAVVALLGVPLGYSIAALGMMQSPQSDPRMVVLAALREAGVRQGYLSAVSGPAAPGVSGPSAPGDLPQSGGVVVDLPRGGASVADLVQPLWRSPAARLQVVAPPYRPVPKQWADGGQAKLFSCGLQPIGPLCPHLILLTSEAD